MADKINKPTTENSDVALEKAKDFWAANGTKIVAIGGALLVLVVGFYVYRNFFQKPKEEKALASLYKAEQYFRMDSLDQALNGDGNNLGFLGVIKKFGGTDAANLAAFYAGSTYVQLNDNANAIKYLKDFSTDSKPIQQRAYLLLGDAYADMGSHKEALDYYKKSAQHFSEDENASAEALFRAGYLSSRVLNNNAEAVKLFTELKEKYGRTVRGQEVDTYLAQLGALNVN